MRGAPQVGFSAAMRKIKARISLLTGFRPPGLCTPEMSRQYRRNPARCHLTPVLGVTRISGFFQPAQSLRNTIQNNLCRVLSRRRGRLVRKARSCWRRARFSRMRSSRERKALITQPMRCRSHEIMAKIVSKHPSTNHWQLVHSPSAPGFDEGQALRITSIDGYNPQNDLDCERPAVTYPDLFAVRRESGCPNEKIIKTRR
jgi:hypothetical protein